MKYLTILIVMLLVGQVCAFGIKPPGCNRAVCGICEGEIGTMPMGMVYCVYCHDWGLEKDMSYIDLMIVVGNSGYWGWWCKNCIKKAIGGQP